MSKNSKELYTFLTRFTAFKYMMMPLSFYYRPSFWQHLIINILLDFLYCFVKIYLDNILIYNKMLKNHCLHISQIFKRL